MIFELLYSAWMSAFVGELSPMRVGYHWRDDSPERFLKYVHLLLNDSPIRVLKVATKTHHANLLSSG